MLLVMLKSCEDPQEDPYLLAVQSRFPSVRPVIVSPHEFRPLRPPPTPPEATAAANSSVVLFTSRRAVQFYADLLLSSAAAADRRPTLCYAVGPATAAAAAASVAGFREVRGGAGCGNAAALCDLVTAELDPARHRILFPCGRVRKDTVETKLARDSGFELTVLEVYDATEKHSLTDELDSLLSSLDAATSDYGLAPRRHQVILAFFSPSSASMVLKQSDWGDNLDIKYLSIGPSTTQRLRELRPDSACLECSAPNVPAFLAALTLCL